MPTMAIAMAGPKKRKPKKDSKVAPDTAKKQKAATDAEGEIENIEDETEPMDNDTAEDETETDGTEEEDPATVGLPPETLLRIRTTAIPARQLVPDSDSERSSMTATRRTFLPHWAAKKATAEAHETALKAVQDAVTALTNVAVLVGGDVGADIVKNTRNIDAAVLTMMRRISNCEGQLAVRKDERAMPPPPPPPPAGKKNGPLMRQLTGPEKRAMAKGQDVEKPVKPQTMRSRSRSRTPGPKTYAVAVRTVAPDGTPDGPDATKEKVLASLPAQMPHARVAGIVRRKDHVVIRMRNEKERDELLRCQTIDRMSFAAPPVAGKKVRLMRIPKEVSVDTIMTELTNRNRDPDVPAEQWRREISFLSRGKMGPSPTVFLEISQRVYTFWLELGSVDINWRLYPIRDPPAVELCFQCFGHGHRGKECTEPKPLCRRCGDDDHSFATCTKPETCRNCRKSGRPDGHGVSSPSCPIYGRALERNQLRTNTAE